MNIKGLQQDIRKIENTYDADHDIAPGVPEVTYTDHRLVKICNGLLDMIDDLQKENRKLYQAVEELDRRVGILADGTGIRTIQI